MRVVWDEAALAALTSPDGPVGEVLVAVGQRVAAEARRRAPYRADDNEHTHVRDAIVCSGPLKHGRSIEVRVSSEAADSAGAPVGLFVEVGTKTMRPQPYLRPALDSARR